MESVKIVIANGTIGSGKTTLSIALANYIQYHLSEIKLQPTLFDCSSNLFILKKRMKELEENSKLIPPYEILTMPLNKDVLFDNGINMIFDREALYIFDIPTDVSQTDLIKILFTTDIIVAPFILTEKGIYETAQFIYFIKQALKYYEDKGLKREPEIILIPNMIPETGIDANIERFWNEKTKAFLPFCNITSNLQWRDNLLQDISTSETHIEHIEFFEQPFGIIAELAQDIYRTHYDGK